VSLRTGTLRGKARRRIRKHVDRLNLVARRSQQDAALKIVHDRRSGRVMVDIERGRA
jgi:hypothetical protein